MGGAGEEVAHMLAALRGRLAFCVFAVSRRCVGGMDGWAEGVERGCGGEREGRRGGGGKGGLLL